MVPATADFTKEEVCRFKKQLEERYDIPDEHYSAWLKNNHSDVSSSDITHNIDSNHQSLVYVTSYSTFPSRASRSQPIQPPTDMTSDSTLPPTHVTSEYTLPSSGSGSQPTQPSTHVTSDSTLLVQPPTHMTSKYILTPLASGSQPVQPPTHVTSKSTLTSPASQSQPIQHHF